MSDYIVFDASLRDRFLDFLAARGLRYGVRPDAMEGFVVSLADDLAEEVEEAVEAEYDTLMAEQQDLVEAADATPALMSVTARLADDRLLTVHLPAEYARRLHEHFSFDEIRGLVAFIAQSALDPAAGPACRQR